MKKTGRNQSSTKYVFVTGGVLSSLGKGLTAASIAALLEHRGLSISLLKMDPYLNVDPGTMNPFQHGEVFVTEDGAETDLDLGHYERFTNVNLRRENSVSAGQVYETVIAKERRGEYLGGTVQVIPHITDEIKDRIRRVGKGKDLVLVEIGGTVGDIESLPFLEAIRQFRFAEGQENVIFLHLTLVPYIGVAGELKTKPTQHSVQKLREIGIQPDILICRTDRELPEDVRAKIALFCNINADDVFAAQDVSNIYEVPVMFHKQGLDQRISERLGLKTKSRGVEMWRGIVDTMAEPENGLVEIGIVGKYVDLTESYKSVSEALVHGAIANRCRLQLRYIDSEKLEKMSDVSEALAGLAGILVPGGFGNRGVEGKIRAIRYAREKKIPYFGICIGLQLAVIEFARNRCGIAKATSREFSNTGEFVIDLLEGQKQVSRLGATMRLGSFPCRLDTGSLASKVYGKREVMERHRHRYEVNNHYRDALATQGLRFSGMYTEMNLVEMMELPEHPWFLGCQFHPEFRSKPFAPHPLFVGFVKASLENRKLVAPRDEKGRAVTPGAAEARAERPATVRSRRTNGRRTPTANA